MYSLLAFPFLSMNNDPSHENPQTITDEPSVDGPSSSAIKERFTPQKQKEIIAEVLSQIAQGQQQREAVIATAENDRNDKKWVLGEVLDKPQTVLLLKSIDNFAVLREQINGDDPEQSKQALKDLEEKVRGIYSTLQRQVNQYDSDVVAISAQIIQANRESRGDLLLSFNDILQEEVSGDTYLIHQALMGEFGFSFGEDIHFNVSPQKLDKLITQVAAENGEEVPQTAEQWHDFTQKYKDQINEWLLTVYQEQFSEFITDLKKREQAVLEELPHIQQVLTNSGESLKELKLSDQVMRDLETHRQQLLQQLDHWYPFDFSPRLGELLRIAGELPTEKKVVELYQRLNTSCQSVAADSSDLITQWQQFDGNTPPNFRQIEKYTNALEDHARELDHQLNSLDDNLPPWLVQKLKEEIFGDEDIATRATHAASQARELLDQSRRGDGIHLDQRDIDELNRQLRPLRDTSLRYPVDTVDHLKQIASLNSSLTAEKEQFTHLRNQVESDLQTLTSSDARSGILSVLLALGAQNANGIYKYAENNAAKFVHDQLDALNESDLSQVSQSIEQLIAFIDSASALAPSVQNYQLDRQAVYDQLERSFKRRFEQRDQDFVGEVGWQHAQRAAIPRLGAERQEKLQAAKISQAVADEVQNQVLKQIRAVIEANQILDQASAVPAESTTEHLEPATTAKIMPVSSVDELEQRIVKLLQTALSSNPQLSQEELGVLVATQVESALALASIDEPLDRSKLNRVDAVIENIAFNQAQDLSKQLSKLKFESTYNQVKATQNDLLVAETATDLETRYQNFSQLRSNFEQSTTAVLEQLEEIFSNSDSSLSPSYQQLKDEYQKLYQFMTEVSSAQTVGDNTYEERIKVFADIEKASDFAQLRQLLDQHHTVLSSLEQSLSGSRVVSKNVSSEVGKIIAQAQEYGNRWEQRTHLPKASGKYLWTRLPACVEQPLKKLVQEYLQTEKGKRAQQFTTLMSSTANFTFTMEQLKNLGWYVPEGARKSCEELFSDLELFFNRVVFQQPGNLEKLLPDGFKFSPLKEKVITLLQQDTRYLMLNEIRLGQITDLDLLIRALAKIGTAFYLGNNDDWSAFNLARMLGNTLRSWDEVAFVQEKKMFLTQKRRRTGREIITYIGAPNMLVKHDPFGVMAAVTKALESYQHSQRKDHLVAEGRAKVEKSAGSYQLLGDQITVGRAQGQDIQFDDNNVSRQHALLTKNKRGYSIVDMGSSNGTFVGSNRLVPRVVTELTHGDVLRFGTNQIMVYKKEGDEFYLRPRTDH